MVPLAVSLSHRVAPCPAVYDCSRTYDGREVDQPGCKRRRAGSSPRQEPQYIGIRSAGHCRATGAAVGVRADWSHVRALVRNGVIAHADGRTFASGAPSVGAAPGPSVLPSSASLRPLWATQPSRRLGTVGARMAMRSAGSWRSAGTGLGIPSARRTSWWWITPSVSPMAPTKPAVRPRGVRWSRRRPTRSEGADRCTPRRAPQPSSSTRAPCPANGGSRKIRPKRSVRTARMPAARRPRRGDAGGVECDGTHAGAHRSEEPPGWLSLRCPRSLVMPRPRPHDA